MGAELLAVLMIPIVVWAMPDVWVPLFLYLGLFFLVCKGVNYVFWKVFDEPLYQKTLDELRNKKPFDELTK